MKDYYKILEVNSSASPETISKVYKYLAKKWHPDANPNNLKEAEEKFKEISEAYEILSDKEKRSKYDEDLKKEHSASYIDINKFYEMQEYCKQLEEKIAFLNSHSSQSTSNTYSANSSHEQVQQSSYTRAQQQAYNQAKQQAYQDAMNKAYHDTYYNTLRNMGYKIRYKKTFKEHLKNLLSILITALILYILFKVPFVRNYITSLITM